MGNKGSKGNPIQLIPPSANAAAAAVQQAGLIVFDKPEIVVGDLSEGNVLQVKLGKDPKGKATLFFAAPSIMFNKCQLQFDSSNFGTFQELRLAGSPYLTPADAARVLEAQFTISSLNNKELHKKTIKFSIKRSKGCGSKCVGWGDPHYTGFDGKQFNMYKNGCHIYIEPKPGKHGLTVQSNTHIPKTAPNISYNRAVAIRYYNTHYVVCSMAGLRRVSKGTEGMKVTVTTAAAGQPQSYEFTLNDGTQISLRRFPVENFFGLDFTAIVPHHRQGTLQGMCGELSNVPPPARGISGEESEKLARANRCRPDDELFTCGQAGKPACKYHDPACKTIEQKCRIPFIKDIPEPAYDVGYAVEPPGDGYAVVGDTPAYAGEEVPATDVTGSSQGAPPCPPDLKNRIEAVCKQAIFHANVHKVLSSDVFIKDCVVDVCLMKDAGYIEASKETYFKSFYNFVKSKTSDPKCAMQEQAMYLGAQAELGIGKADCIQHCSKQGECRHYGCRCHPGFTGKHCEINLKTFKM